MMNYSSEGHKILHGIHVQVTQPTSKFDRLHLSAKSNHEGMVDNTFWLGREGRRDSGDMMAQKIKTGGLGGGTWHNSCYGSIVIEYSCIE